MKTLIARMLLIGGNWSEIRLGSRRLVTCSCGGQFTDRPHQYDFDVLRDSGLSVGCRHIEALYRGHVTTDKRKAKASGYATMYGSSRPQLSFVQLTQVGKGMFEWRWAAQALTKS